MIKPHFFISMVVVAIGIALSLVSYLYYGSILLTAVGLSLIISGLTWLVLSITGHPTSPASITTRTYVMLFGVVAIVLIVADCVLDFFKQSDIAIYFIIKAIIYLITIWIFIALYPRLRNRLMIVGSIVFTVFFVMIILKIINALV